MIHIACNIDHNYVQHCAVTLLSLFVNNDGTDFTIHIIARKLSSEDEQILIRLTAPYGHKILFHLPDEQMLEGFTIRATHNRLSQAAYFRCFLSALLPADIHRVLYLDCDILVLGDILPLWETSLDTNTAVAAVRDMGCNEPQRYEILKYPMEYSYFNSGVMLVNLDYWRTHNIPHACVDFYHKYPDRIIFNDQDLLNCVLHEHKKLVELKWNVQDAFYRDMPANSTEWRQANAKTLCHPTILHYTNRKPWLYDSQHPLRNEYFKYWDMTPWKDYKPWKSSANRLKRFFRLLPYYVGLRKPKYYSLTTLN